VAEDPTAPTPPAGMTGELGPLMRLISNQKLAFLAVGGVNTAIGSGWFVVWELLTGDRLGYQFSLVAAYFCSVVTAFLMYRFLVFKVRGNFVRDLGRFAVVNFGAFLVNLLLMTVAVSGFDLPRIPSQLVITAVLAVAQFFGYRDFSFKRHGAPTAAPGPDAASERGGA
jgi:putative flippase GtrA